MRVTNARPGGCSRPRAERKLSEAACTNLGDEPVGSLRVAALAKRKALGALRDGAVAVGLAIATFLLSTLSVQFWLAAGSLSGTSSPAQIYSQPSVTPDPHP